MKEKSLYYFHKKLKIKKKTKKTKKKHFQWVFLGGFFFFFFGWVFLGGFFNPNPVIKGELVDQLWSCNFVPMLFTNSFISPSGVEGSDKGEPEEEVAKPNPPNPILGHVWA